MSPEQALLPLHNPIMHYAWGSPTAIPELLGRSNPEGGPWAEMWMGAHARAPSSVYVGGAPVRLDALIEQEPKLILGTDRLAPTPPQMPFLFKVLAAASPLSIQCHPSRQRAFEGFVREERAGIPRDAPNRSYRDANHKPELLVAMSRFTALKGFRPAEQILADLEARIPAHVLPEMRTLKQGASGIRTFFSALLNLPVRRRCRLLDELLRRSPPGDLVHQLHKEHPGDVGVLAPLLFNTVTLDPGQALYLEAGELHAYLQGLGLELMASSDNVLRGGLTSKHVDLPELLRAASFLPSHPEVLSLVPVSAVESVYRTPAPDFALSVLQLAPRRVFIAPERRSVEILLCVSGSVVAECGPRSTRMRKGSSLLAPAEAGTYRLSGQGCVYRARARLS